VTFPPWPGREWLAALGFVVTLAAVIGLTRFAEPQHHHQMVHRHDERALRRAAALSASRH